MQKIVVFEQKKYFAKKLILDIYEFGMIYLIVLK